MAAIAASKTSDRRIVFEAARAITTTRINIRAVPLMPFGIALRPDSQNRLDWPIYSPCKSSACPAAASRFPLARIGITRSSTTAFACCAASEGMVSKHRDRPYRGGRQKHWIKVKNRKHPACERVKESFS